MRTRDFTTAAIRIRQPRSQRLAGSALALVLAAATALACAPAPAETPFSRLQIAALNEQGTLVNGASLHKAMDRSLARIVTSYRAGGDKELRHRGASPFLTATAEAARSLEALKQATVRRDAEKLAAAVSRMARAVAQVNATYRYAQAKNARVREGVDVLVNSWQAFSDQYGRRLAQRVTLAPAQETEMRRLRGEVAELRRQLSDLRSQLSADRRLAREIDLMLAEVRRAERARADAVGLWLTLNTFDVVFGWLHGYRSYAVVYHPTYARHFVVFDTYWPRVQRTVVHHYHHHYYQSFSWTYYEERHVVRENVTIVATTAEAVVLDAAAATLSEDAASLADEAAVYSEAGVDDFATASDPTESGATATEAELEPGLLDDASLTPESAATGVSEPEAMIDTGEYGEEAASDVAAVAPNAEDVASETTDGASSPVASEEPEEWSFDEAASPAPDESAADQMAPEGAPSEEMIEAMPETESTSE